MSDSVTPQTIANQAPLSMRFAQQEYWNGLPFPSPGIFPTQGSNLHCLQVLSPALAGGFLTAKPPGKPKLHMTGIGIFIL